MENSTTTPDHKYYEHKKSEREYLVKSDKFIPWVGFQLKKRRWLIMSLFGLAIIIIEALEHLSVRESVFTTHFLTEVIVYGISIPILGAFLLNWVDKVELERQAAESELYQIHEFSDQLRNSQSWDDLTKLILSFPNTVLPVKSCTLFMNNPDLDRLEYIDTWRAEGNNQVDPRLEINLEQCNSCQQWSYPMTGSHKCSLLLDSQFTPGSEWHCLPLVYKNYLSGIIMISLSEGQKISNQQFKTMGEFTPKIALALENYYLQKRAQTQTESSITERNRIARDLHDTLGQNLSFLRLKLDQMSEQSNLLSIGELEHSLAGMRDIANEAYLQMRATLADLHSSANLELSQALSVHAQKVAERANFQVEIIIQGESVQLQPHVKRQILYICREALNNIEKHANAQLVIIDLDWREENLTLTIKDNGCGLISRDLCGENHMGMTIMSERANDINAQLSFDSQEGQGLSVSLIVPFSTSLIRQ